MLIPRFCLLLSLVVPVAYSQKPRPPIPSPAAYRASLVKLQKEQIPEWQKALKQIDVERLSVGYATGKLIENARRRTLDWLAISDATADTVLSTGSVSDEISLAYGINELSHAMSDLAGMLAALNLQTGEVNDAKIKWTEQLDALSTGPVNDLTLSALYFTVAQAAEMERRCHP